MAALFPLHQPHQGCTGEHLASNTTKPTPQRDNERERERHKGSHTFLPNKREVTSRALLPFRQQTEVDELLRHKLSRSDQNSVQCRPQTRSQTGPTPGVGAIGARGWERDKLTIPGTHASPKPRRDHTPQIDRRQALHMRDSKARASKSPERREKKRKDAAKERRWPVGDKTVEKDDENKNKQGWEEMKKRRLTRMHKRSPKGK